jgi:hypothetical protein
MLPSQRPGKPDAPTRLAKERRKSDWFKFFVHYLSDTDLFIIVNYSATAELYDWVVIGELDSGEPRIALYEGQEYIGVVEIMEFYQLTQSEQWLPRIGLRF